MSQTAGGFTKQMARNMFYGGSLFFILVFVALIFDSEHKIPQRSNAQAITPSVVAGMCSILASASRSAGSAPGNGWRPFWMARISTRWLWNSRPFSARHRRTRREALDLQA